MQLQDLRGEWPPEPSISRPTSAYRLKKACLRVRIISKPAPKARSCGTAARNLFFSPLKLHHASYTPLLLRFVSVATAMMASIPLPPGPDVLLFPQLLHTRHSQGIQRDTLHNGEERLFLD